MKDWKPGDRVVIDVPNNLTANFIEHNAKGYIGGHKERKGSEIHGTEGVIAAVSGSLVWVYRDGQLDGTRLPLDYIFVKPIPSEEPEPQKAQPMNLSDTHYRALESKGQEPIVRMEAIICRGIPEEYHEIAKRNLNMALASKHEDRAGEKAGEDWRKELTKSENYLHRAVHGCWIGQEKAEGPEEKSLFCQEFEKNLFGAKYPDLHAVVGGLPPLTSREKGIVSGMVLASANAQAAEIQKAKEAPAPVDTWVEDENHWTDPETGKRYRAEHTGAKNGEGDCFGCDLKDDGCSRFLGHCGTVRADQKDDVIWKEVSK